MEPETVETEGRNLNRVILPIASSRNKEMKLWQCGRTVLLEKEKNSWEIVKSLAEALAIGDGWLTKSAVQSLVEAFEDIEDQRSLRKEKMTKAAKSCCK